MPIINYQKGKLRKQSHLLLHQKYLGINLTKDVKDLYSENYKTPKKNIEGANKWKPLLCSWIEIINIIKTSILPREIHRFDRIPIKYQWHYPTKLEEIYQKFIWNHSKL